jgi:hypothetical protein
MFSVASGEWWRRRGWLAERWEIVKHKNKVKMRIKVVRGFFVMSWINFSRWPDNHDLKNLLTHSAFDGRDSEKEMKSLAFDDEFSFSFCFLMRKTISFITIQLVSDHHHHHQH